MYVITMSQYNIFYLTIHNININSYLNTMSPLFGGWLPVVGVMPIKKKKKRRSMKGLSVW